MIAADVQVGQPTAEPAATAGSTKPTGTQLVAGGRRGRWPRRGRPPGRDGPRWWTGCWRRRSRWTTRSANATGDWGVLAVLGWLREQPGDSWQQRWRASGAEDQPDWRRLVGTDRAAPLPHLTPGLLVLICADVIRPSLDWLLRFIPVRHNLAAEMATRRSGRVRRAHRAVSGPNRTAMPAAGADQRRDHHGC